MCLSSSETLHENTANCYQETLANALTRDRVRGAGHVEILGYLSAYKILGRKNFTGKGGW